MSFNVLVAEPSNDAWIAILRGIRRQFRDALILRVKDGEQALKFLFYRGLLTDDPPIPDLVLLAADLPVVSAEEVFARLRQHPRMRATPVIVNALSNGETKVTLPQAFRAKERLWTLCGPGSLETQVSEAVHRLAAFMLVAHSSDELGELESEA